MSIQDNSPGITVRVALLLVLYSPLISDANIHCTVVPLFTDVAGTVRVDCTVPDDVDATILADTP